MSAYSKTVRSLIARGGTTTCFTFPWPSPSVLTRLRAQQVDSGDPADFTIRALNSRKPCDGPENSLSSVHSLSSQSSGGSEPDGDYEASPGSYQVLPQEAGRIASSDGLAEYAPSKNVPYLNVDGGFIVPIYEIYLEVVVSTPDDIALDITLHGYNGDYAW